MAIATKKIQDDTSSRVAHETRKTLNALLTAVDTSTDYASLKLNIQTACKAILTTIEVPAPPEAPAV